VVGTLVDLDLPSDRVSDRIAAAGEGRVCTLSSVVGTIIPKEILIPRRRSPAAAKAVLILWHLRTA
jgi:hypothetical protein